MPAFTILLIDDDFISFRWGRKRFAAIDFEAGDTSIDTSHDKFS